MARPIEYDKEQVLRNAMMVFWQKGYEPTSMKDLVEATGLSTRSMYNIFESKNGLFKASLTWYYDNGSKKRIAILKEEQGLQAVRNFVMAVALSANRKGCLFVNTSSDRHNIESSSLEIVDQYFENLEGLFKEKLLYANEHEAYDFDAGLRAKQLVLILQGLSVHSKHVTSFDENRHIVEDFLKLMEI